MAVHLSLWPNYTFSFRIFVCVDACQRNHAVHFTRHQRVWHRSMLLGLGGLQHEAPQKTTVSKDIGNNFFPVSSVGATSYRRDGLLGYDEIERNVPCLWHLLQTMVRAAKKNVSTNREKHFTKALPHGRTANCIFVRT